MVSISESRERVEAEGQREGAVALAAPRPWQSPHRGLRGKGGGGGLLTASLKSEIIQEGAGPKRSLSPCP